MDTVNSSITTVGLTVHNKRIISQGRLPCHPTDVLWNTTYPISSCWPLGGERHVSFFPRVAPGGGSYVARRGQQAGWVPRYPRHVSGGRRGVGRDVGLRPPWLGLGAREEKPPPLQRVRVLSSLVSLRAGRVGAAGGSRCFLCWVSRLSLRRGWRDESPPREDEGGGDDLERHGSRRVVMHPSLPVLRATLSVVPSTRKPPGVVLSEGALRFSPGAHLSTCTVFPRVDSNDA